MNEEQVNDSILSVNVKISRSDSLKSQSLKFQHSNHSFQRAAQRGIDYAMIQTIVEYGEAIFKQGMVFYVLGNKDKPDGRLSKDWKKFQNLVVVVAGDSNQIITCYRNSNPYKYIRKKTKELSKLTNGANFNMVA